jgi:hypothetical protein
MYKHLIEEHSRAALDASSYESGMWRTARMGHGTCGRGGVVRTSDVQEGAAGGFGGFLEG